MDKKQTENKKRNNLLKITKIFLTFLIIGFISCILFINFSFANNQNPIHNIKSQNSIKVKNTKKNNNNPNHSIIQKPNYDESYTNKLNQDIKNVKEPKLNELDSYEWEKEIYPKTHIDNEKSIPLGNYSYQTKIPGQYSTTKTEIYHSVPYKKGKQEFSNDQVQFIFNFNGTSPIQEKTFITKIDDNDIHFHTHINFPINKKIDPNNKNYYIDFRVYSAWNGGYYDKQGYSNITLDRKRTWDDNSDDTELMGWQTILPKNELQKAIPKINNLKTLNLKSVEWDAHIDGSNVGGRWSKPNITEVEYNFEKPKSNKWIFKWEYWTKDIYKDKLANINYHPIYIGEDYLQKHSFSQNELENLIKLQSGSTDISNYVHFQNLKIDKTNRKLIGDYDIRNYFSNQSNMPWKSFEIPIKNKIQNRSTIIKAKPIFINKKDYDNGLTSDELSKLIQFEKMDMDNIDFTNLSIDKTKRKITGSYSIKGLDANQVNIKKQKLNVSFKIIDTDYLFTISPESASEWKHLPNGKIKYWQTPPETIITYNNDWIHSFYTYTKTNEIKNKFNSEIASWGFENSDQKLVQGKLGNYAINYWNYDDVKRSYINNKDTNYLNSLVPETFLNDYNHLENANFNDYLYVLKNSILKVEYRENNHSDFKNIPLDNFQFEKLSLEEKHINESPAKTQWDLEFKFFIFSNIQNISPYGNDKKIQSLAKSVKSKNYQYLHDINIQEQNGSLIHKYFYQAEGIDLGQDISFAMEDGTILDQNFKVIVQGNNNDLKVNDFGFVNARYWAELPNGQKEFITLINQNGQWYSPKFQDTITNLDSSFTVDKLEYVFNQNLNMVVNPYGKSLNATNNKITASDIPRYGIEKVKELYNNKTELVLETWDSGKFSHTSQINGKALFDGVFGADTTGHYDPVGFLTEGNHQIQIDLKVANSNLQNIFNITIDKNPVEINVNSNGYLKELNIYDQNENIQELWYSNEPINLVINELDIARINAWILHSNGTWYELPVNIKSVLEGKNWVQKIDTTFDYEGFAKIQILDQAQNSKTIYFLTNKNENELPIIHLDKTKIFENTSYQTEELNIFNQVNELLITNPLVNDVKVHKILFDEENNLTEEDYSQIIEDYEIEAFDNYDFGTTLNSEDSRLPYVVDELNPFIANLTEITNEKWITHNKKINLRGNGLYKVELSTALVNTPRIVKYFYLNDQKVVSLINENEFQKEKSYLGSLPEMPIPSDFEEVKSFLNLKKVQISNEAELKNDQKTKKLIIDSIKKTNNYLSLSADQLVILNSLLDEKYLTIDFNDNNEAVFQNKDQVLEVEISQVDPSILSSYEEEIQSEKNEKWLLRDVDEVVNWLEKLHLNLFDFEINNLEIQYSLPWYSEFNKLENWKKELKEGKYKVHFEDIYGNTKDYQFLLLDKDLSNDDRENRNLIQIYLEEGNENTAFWKGNYIWNFWRYEDQDHVKWEYEQFVKDWIFNGLDPELAELAYKMAKLDPNWDGNFNNGPPSGDSNWNDFLNNEEWINKIDNQENEIINQFENNYNMNLSNSKSQNTELNFEQIEQKLFKPNFQKQKVVIKPILFLECPLFQ